jgi:hypothetical protein
MAMSSLFKKKEKLALVFDIGSSSVGGALFYMQSSGVPKIIFSIREPIILEEKISPERFSFLTIRSLKIVADKIATKGLGAPYKIFCVLSSPWFISQTRTIKLEKNTPFVFTSKLADSLTEKEVSLFEEEHINKYKDIGSPVRPIEFKNMKTVLNGYPTASPLNQKARELEMMIFLSMSGEQILQKIEDVTAKYFHTKEVKFSSFQMTAFAVARDMFVHQDNFLLVDIGGEVTDISMIKKDVLCESMSFPMGRNFLIRGVASGMGCSLDEAKSLLSLYKDGHAAQSTEKTLGPILDKLKGEWLRKFQESLASISTDISIPATIFITVDPGLTGFFSETIKTEQFSQYTLTESKFRVIFLGTEALHGITLFEENTARDAFLIIESIYINRFLR